MIHDVELFIALAEIAGVFVGFGALISLTRKNAIEFFQLGRLRGVVSIGLVVIVASLVPVGVSRYGIIGHDLWFICSIIFFILMQAMWIISLRKPKIRKLASEKTRKSPFANLFFLVVLEAPIHVSLVLTMLGIYPDLEPAFYITALLFNLFEAAFVLVQIVHYQMGSSTKIGEQDESHVLVH